MANISQQHVLSLFLSHFRLEIYNLASGGIAQLSNAEIQLIHLANPPGGGLFKLVFIFRRFSDGGAET